MSQMQAAQVTERKKEGGRYEVRTVDKPAAPKGTELLIRVAVAGFCHTDTMVMSGDPSLPSANTELPLTGSHEPSGKVEAVGPDVKDFKVGDRVAALCFKDPCGNCKFCGSDSRFCDNQRFVGLTTHGAFAEYVIVDSKSAAKIPDSLSFEQAAPLTCAGATIWSAIKRTKLRKGQSLAIVGLGALGHIGVQLAKALGYKVVGIDARNEPLELVKKAKHAPDLALNANDGKDAIVKAIKDKFGDEGVSAVIDATGVAKGHELALHILKKHGLFVLVSQPPEPLAISYFDLIFRDITIKGSLLATREQFAELLQFVGEHEIKVDVRSYKLADINKMLEESHSSSVTGKAVVSFE